MTARAAAAERRNLLVLALVTLAPFVLLSVWARVASPAPWEPAVLSGVVLGGDPAADVVRAINVLGNLPVWAALVALLAVVLRLVRGLAAGLVVALSLAADFAAFCVKVLVERQRPETIATEHFVGLESFAYPSGHVVRAVALAGIVAWLLAPPRWRVPALLGAGTTAGLLMGYARVALNVHWPTDALGGVLLGLGWAALSARLVR